MIWDVEKKKQFSAHGKEDIEKFLSHLAKYNTLVGHNIIGYDLPVIQKLYPDWSTAAVLHDTLIMGRSYYTDMRDRDFARRRSRTPVPPKLIGSHALKAYGYRLGLHKGEYQEEGGTWEKWTPAMEEYCERDVQVTKRLYEHLMARMPSDQIETENELAQYLAYQERGGFPFDKGKAEELYAMLAAKREARSAELAAAIPPFIDSSEFTPKVNNKARGYVKGVTITRETKTQFNPGSRQHIARHLTERCGWTPSVFTETGLPQVDETAISAIAPTVFPQKEALLDYLLLDKRVGQIAEGRQAWLRLARLNAQTGMHHLYGRVNQSGCITHRGSHYDPNIGQVPKVTSEYGMECRALFTVPDGYLMVGADASGLELRCLAHYLAHYDNGEYGKVILEGDVHATNRDALGLAGKEGRDTAKTFIYAYLYGAGDEKIGHIVYPGVSDDKAKKLGKKLRRRFEQNIPALGLLSAAVREKARQHGSVKLIDGRRCPVRSEHSALNSLLQGTGAVICKRWIVQFSRGMYHAYGSPGWTDEAQWSPLEWVHDEIGVAVRAEEAEDVAAYAVGSIECMTEHFNFRIPLTGDAKVGKSWAETH